MVSLKKDGWCLISGGQFPMTSALNHDQIYDPRPKVYAKTEHKQTVNSWATI